VSNGNQYFETQNRIENELSEESLVARIEECNMVLSELSKSTVWQIVIRDAQELIKQLDNSWQDMPIDDPKLREARVVKMACKHICDLPRKYLKEQEDIEKTLAEMQNPEVAIQKDNDNS
jgi:hypothetical protein